MVAHWTHLAFLASAFVPVPVLQPPASSYYAADQEVVQFWTPRVEPSAIVMNTNYGDPFVRNNKKKNKMTGSTKNLKGYTVGSRAPPTAIRSGTNAQFGYGINNLYGGKAKLAALQGKDKVGKKSAVDPSGFGTIFVFLAVIIFIGSALKN